MKNRRKGNGMKAQIEETWEQIGEVGVDSATLMLVDPTYEVKPEEIEAAWGAMSQGRPATVGPRGLGLLAGTGIDDGLYPVEVRRAEGGYIAEVRVRFLPHPSLPGMTAADALARVAPAPQG
jgi:hypothetical protein